MCSKHVEAWNILIIKFSASNWLILRNKCIETQGQQNIKIWGTVGVLCQCHDVIQYNINFRQEPTLSLSKQFVIIQISPKGTILFHLPVSRRSHVTEMQKYLPMKITKLSNRIGYYSFLQHWRSDRRLKLICRIHLVHRTIRDGTLPSRLHGEILKIKLRVRDSVFLPWYSPFLAEVWSQCSKQPNTGNCVQSAKSSEEFLQLLVQLNVRHVLSHKSVLSKLSSFKRSSFKVVVLRVQFMHVTSLHRQWHIPILCRSRNIKFWTARNIEIFTSFTLYELRCVSVCTTGTVHQWSHRNQYWKSDYSLILFRRLTYVQLARFHTKTQYTY